MIESLISGSKKQYNNEKELNEDFFHYFNLLITLYSLEESLKEQNLYKLVRIMPLKNIFQILYIILDILFYIPLKNYF